VQCLGEMPWEGRATAFEPDSGTYRAGSSESQSPAFADFLVSVAAVGLVSGIPRPLGLEHCCSAPRDCRQDHCDTPIRQRTWQRKRAFPAQAYRSSWRWWPH